LRPALDCLSHQISGRHEMSNASVSEEKGYLDMDLLRFTTAGSVDDGKSTLIGRLMYDSKAIFEDQLESIERSSRQRGDENVNLALLTDGLRAEREQGITIDVAYRYFATPRRKFIIADTPGHIQHTRNMVTGSSTANLAIILVDARKGVIEQTCRHAFIANLLRIQHVVIAVNKMDLVDWSEERFNEIRDEFQKFASRLDSIVEISFILISALKGDNVVESSSSMPWYKGPTLLYHLETVYVGPDANHVDARLPVQWVVRPHSDEYHDYRGYAGRVAGGVFRPGDEVLVCPSGFTAKVKALRTADGELERAFAPLSVSMTLDREIDISRGDMIAKPDNPPAVGQDIDAMVCWFSEKPLNPRGKFLIRHCSKEAKALVKELKYKVDINTLHKIQDNHEFLLNDIGRMTLRVASPLCFDSYRRNRVTGSFVLVDAFTNETVAAGMIR